MGNVHTWERFVPPKPDPAIIDSIHARLEKTFKKIAKSGMTVDRGFLNRIRTGLNVAAAGKGLVKGMLVDFKTVPAGPIRLIAGRQAGKSASLGQMYGHTSPSGDWHVSGTHWRCRTCGLDHWSDDEPPRHVLELLLERVEGGVHYELRLTQARFSAMPAMRVGLFRSCDEELVRDVMES